MENPNYIIWREAKKLEVLDFKALVKPLDVRGINVAACCASSIYMKSQKNFRYIWDGKVNNVEVVSFFDCSRSWFDRSHLDNDILEHEQIHFDITELIARRLRNKIHLHSKAVSPSSLQFEYESSLHALNEIQEKYDSETEHGRLYNKQVIWKEYVQKELISLSEY